MPARDKDGTTMQTPPANMRTAGTAGPAAPAAPDVASAGMQLADVGVRGAGMAPQAPAAGAVRRGVADGIRATGAGLRTSHEVLGVEADKIYIHPYESVYAAGKAVGRVTSKVPPVHRVTSKAFTIVGFMTAFQGMMVGSVLRAPGRVAGDMANSVADRIDGRTTFDGDLSPMSPASRATQPGRQAGPLLTP